jgi:hypothetical protein
MPEADSFVIPETSARRVEFVQTGNRSYNRRSNTPKPQQNLVAIIRDIVLSAGHPCGYAEVRAALDVSERYEFKRGCEGWRRTNQITSAVHNHIKKHGEQALLAKTGDGKITIKN